MHLGKIKEIAQPTKTCSINKSKDLLSFLSSSFFLVSNFFHFTINVSFGNEVVNQRLQIFTNCYATSFPRFLSLLPSNTRLDLSQSLHQAISNTCRKKNICTAMFVFNFQNAAAEIFLWNYELISQACLFYKYSRLIRVKTIVLRNKRSVQGFSRHIYKKT